MKKRINTCNWLIFPKNYEEQKMKADLKEL